MDRPLDMQGAAEALGISRRTLVDALKDLPHYELRGRKKVFYPEHISALRRGMHRCALERKRLTDGGMSTAPVLMGSASESLSRLATLAAQRKHAHR